MLRRNVVVLLALLIAASSAIASTTYQSEMEEFRKKRDERLRSASYYLAITGLFWLEEGPNSFGGADDNDLAFPGKNVPARMGTIRVKRGALSVTIDSGVAVTSGGEVVEPMMPYDLYHDNDLEHDATRLKHGTLTWLVIKRGPKLAVRLMDDNSPLIASYRGGDWYDVDPTWRLEGRFEEYDPVRPFRMANVTGVETDEVYIGAVTFTKGAKQYRLDVVAERGVEELWIVFGDQTSGMTTYGGGRQLYIDPPDKSGNVVIDFNKSFNLPCAFSPYTTCPLPPEQNRLPIGVTAGEKKYEADPGYSNH